MFWCIHILSAGYYEICVITDYISSDRQQFCQSKRIVSPVVFSVIMVIIHTHVYSLLHYATLTASSIIVLNGTHRDIPYRAYLNVIELYAKTQDAKSPYMKRDKSIRWLTPLQILQHMHLTQAVDVDVVVMVIKTAISSCMSNDDIDIVIGEIHRIYSLLRDDDAVRDDVSMRCRCVCPFSSLSDVLTMYGTYEYPLSDLIMPAIYGGDLECSRMFDLDESVVTLLIKASGWSHNIPLLVKLLTVCGNGLVSNCTTMYMTVPFVDVWWDVWTITSTDPNSHASIIWPYVRDIECARRLIEMNVHVHADAVGHLDVNIVRFLIEGEHLFVDDELALRVVKNCDASLDVIDCLLNNGAQINAVDEYGNDLMVLTPFRARYYLNRGIFIRKYGGKPLIVEIVVGVLECSYDRADAIRSLYSVGINVNDIDDRGNTALYYAYKCHVHQRIVDALLECGAHFGSGGDIVSLLTQQCDDI